MLKFNKKSSFLFSTILLMTLSLVTLSFANGASIENDNKNIYIGSDKVIENNFIQAVGTIDFNGQAKKDIIIAGGTININGPISGDVLVVGGDVKINGYVGGNIRVIGGNIDINSKVGKNVSIFGGTVTLGEDAEVDWDLFIFAGKIDVRGRVKGNIKGGGGNVILANEIGGNVNLKIINGKSDFILYPQANIKGDLVYNSSAEVQIKEGAKIAGETIYTSTPLPIIPVKKDLEKINYFKKFASIAKIMTLTSSLIVGLIVVYLAKKTSKKIGERMIEKPWASIGLGMVYLIIFPIALILVTTTIIGVPLSLIVLGCYMISLYLTKIFVGVVLGQKLLKWINKKQDVSLTGGMILGMVVFHVLINLPLIGWTISLLGTCWALGAMIETKKEIFKKIEG